MGDRLDDGTEMDDGYAVPPYLRSHPLYAAAEASVTTERAAEADMLRRLLDELPIYAVRVGYRIDSTDEERRIGDAAWAAHRAWIEALALPRSGDTG